MATVLAVCSSERTILPKKQLERSLFLKDHGIDGDSHAGSELRQVSLLRLEDIKKAEEEAGFEIPFGALAENLVVSGLPEDISTGTLLRLDDRVTLEFVEKGKKPGEIHTYDYRGLCLLPEKGYFLRVLNGGEIVPPCEAFIELSR